MGALDKKKASYEGNGYVITWALGHLLGLSDPSDYDSRYKTWRLSDLPILPDRFVLSPQANPGHLSQVVSLIRQKRFDVIINACDAGREGELIFRWILEWSGEEARCKRLWLSSLTKGAILEAMCCPRPAEEFDSLADAARCRAESDWLVGINATRAMTKKSGSLISVGRVQTPTLAMIVAREQEILGFKPVRFWTVQVRVRHGQDEFGAQWVHPDPTKKDRLGSAEEANEVLRRLRESPQTVVSDISHTESAHNPPSLFDLTDLQREMNNRYGFAAHKTLSLAQALYEKKAITYPRTDSRHISAKTIPLVASALDALEPHYGREIARMRYLAGGKPPYASLVREAMVRDHHAILPTADVPRLTGDLQLVYDAISRRLLAALYPPNVRRETEAIIAAGRDRLRARGSLTLVEGWREVIPGQPDEPLPCLRIGDQADIISAEAREGTTSPPRRYTDASLLRAMQTAGKDIDDEALRDALRHKGLGTAATRAAIIERLLEVGYIERRSREIMPTQKGMSVIQMLPVRELTSASLTAEWEMKLSMIESGSLSREQFMNDMKQYVSALVSSIKQMRQQKVSDDLGACPKCGGRVESRARCYRCGSCGLSLPSEIASKKLDRAHVSALLSKGKTPLLAGFRSKSGGRFSAYLVLTEGVLKFEFPKARKSRAKKKPEKTG